jgi:hypothetical protein
MQATSEPICRDVLSPDFERLNAPAGYDPNHNYVGSEWLYQHWHIALEQHFCGVSINRAAWLHDQAYDVARTMGDWDEANDVFRDDVIKLIAHGSTSRWRIVRWGRVGVAYAVGWLHFVGVESAPALLDWWLCRPKNEG